MKALTLTLFLAFGSLYASAEDWTVDGKTYQDVKILEQNSRSVSIMYANGAANLPLSALPPEIQKKLNYAPDKAAADEAATEKAALEKALNSFLDSGITYDKFKDEISFWSPDFQLRSHLKFNIVIVNKGSKLTKPDLFDLIILWSGKDWHYIHNSEIIFLADDLRIHADNGFDKDGRIEDDGTVIESITIDLKPSELKAIGEAKSLSLRAGEDEETLPANFQEISERLI